MHYNVTSADAYVKGVIQAKTAGGEWVCAPSFIKQLYNLHVIRDFQLESLHGL